MSDPDDPAAPMRRGGHGRIVGLILAGGLSSRLGGGVKGLRPLAGRPMIAHVIERLAPQVEALALNANAPGLDGFGLPVLPDPVAGFPGPLAGLLAGLVWAAELPGVTHLVTAASDSPFLPRDLVARLAEGPAEGPVLARTDSGPEPVFGLWPVALRDDLSAWLDGGGSRRVQDFAAACRAEYHAFSDDSAPFFNVNTPEDLALAEARATRAED